MSKIDNMGAFFENLLFLTLLSVFCSSFKGLENINGKGDKQKLKLIVLDPGHFHASLLQKNKLPLINDTVWVYAPKGIELEQYLANIKTYNERKDNPTHWHTIIYSGSDYLSKMLADHKGDIVVLAGNNQKKTRYILASIKSGYNVLADKPMAINQEDFKLLVEAYKLAKKKNLLLYDLMTERYDILNIIEKKLLHDKHLFGTLEKGTLTNPGIFMESVHYFFKKVSGKPLIRPAWYYDVNQQGEGIADVTTHLIDIINWQCFPDQSIYESDLNFLSATHWATPITLQEFRQSTLVDRFPDYLKKYIRKDTLEVMSNGILKYTLKGIHVSMKVIWNYMPPDGDSGDIFTSVKRGTKATLKIVQNRKNQFLKQLYIQRNSGVDAQIFEKHLNDLVNKLQSRYPFISVSNDGHGIYLINIPVKNRLGHEAHFSKVAECYFRYLLGKKLPGWENENTVTKYYITTKAVKLVHNSIY